MRPLSSTSNTFQVEWLATDFEVVHSFNHDCATVGDQRLDVDGRARHDLHNRFEFGSDGVDSPMDSSWAVDVEGAVGEKVVSSSTSDFTKEAK